MTKRRILIVEDEQDIAELVALHLGDLCDETVIASDGYEGMRLATAEPWAAIILDLRLPGPDGLEICRVVRRERELGGRAGVAERLERGRWSIDLAWER